KERGMNRDRSHRKRRVRHVTGRTPDTRVTRRTVELHGAWSQGVLRAVVQRAFAAGKTVRFEGRLWTVEKFEPSTDPSQPLQWTALLVNTEPAL
ncbi:MAG TPA: hypothetical protein VFJ95_16980, partial [Gammaproteobacteria bacterium]|nr:hypothetical protein [Gammaproteobacteria bacterium]